MLDPKQDACWTDAHVQSFAVRYAYPVYFTRSLFDPTNPCLRQAVTRIEPDKRHRLAVFIDEGVTLANPKLVLGLARYADHHSTAMDIAGDIVVIPGGEAIKNQHSCVEHILRDLAARRIDRHSFAVTIGGGAVLDAAGFAAAIFHRGVRHIRCPTTVLAQSDSGVGVKNAINGFGLKNLLGTFAPPFAVINDTAFITTLPARDRRCGIAEAVKVALIRDAGFFIWLEVQADALARFEPNPLDLMVRRCAMLHMHQIAYGGDPFETGAARPLDYGHWSAHKLETLSRHELRHGEAVAIGVALDARYSALAGLLAPGEDERIARLLERVGFRLWHRSLDLRDEQGRRRVLAGLNDFREHLGGELTITLLGDIGRGIEVHEMEETLIERAIRWLRDRGKRRTDHAAPATAR